MLSNSYRRRPPMGLALPEATAPHVPGAQRQRERFTQSSVHSCRQPLVGPLMTGDLGTAVSLRASGPERAQSVAPTPPNQAPSPCDCTRRVKCRSRSIHPDHSASRPPVRRRRSRKSSRTTRTGVHSEVLRSHVMVLVRPSLGRQCQAFDATSSTAEPSRTYEALALTHR